MDIKTYGYKITVGADGYLDNQMKIVADLAELSSITASESSTLFIGMTATVTNIIDSVSYPFEVVLVNGKLKYNWQLHTYLSLPTYASLTDLSASAISNLSTTGRAKKYSNLFPAGTIVTVIADENNDGKTIQYISKGVVSGVYVWEKFTSDSEITIEGNDRDIY